MTKKFRIRLDTVSYTHLFRVSMLKTRITMPEDNSATREETPSRQISIAVFRCIPVSYTHLRPFFTRPAIIKKCQKTNLKVAEEWQETAGKRRRNICQK